MIGFGGLLDFHGNGLETLGAVEIGLACMKLTPWNNIWLTILANLAGGAAAAGCFYLIHPKADRD